MNNQTQRYVPLHLHTMYSIDSVTSISDLFQTAKDMGFKAIAITDHSSLSGVVEGFKGANETGVKYICGCEIYLYNDMSPFPEASTYPSGKKRLSHLTLLCNGMEGYNTIVGLVNNAKNRGEYGFRSPIYLSELVKNNKGLYCLTGCPASLAQDENEKIAFEFVRTLYDTFGKNRLFAEAQFHNLQTAKHFDRATKISNEFDLKLIYTNDCHYLKKGNFPEYTKFKKWVFGGKDDEDENFSMALLYLADSGEIEDIAMQLTNLSGKDYVTPLKAGMQNSLDLADILDTVDMSGRDAIFPPVVDADNQFDTMIKEGVVERGIDLTNLDYKTRLDKELKVIKDKGFVPYFVVVSDFCNYAKSHDLIMGVGRGSAAGSLVSYILGITHLDPIKYGLTFERFLSEHRKSLPDIDSDFSGEGRDKIVEYAAEKYGMKPVGTFVFFGHKEAVNFAAKHCGVPYAEVEQLRTELENGNIELDELDELPKAVTNLFKKYETARLEEMYKFVYGKLKSIGQHAGGIVYVDETAPLEIKKNGGVIVALPEGKHGEYLSHRGFVKVDILGISTLQVIQECYRKTKVLPPEPNGIEPAIELLNKGENAGIFQFKGSTMTNLIRKFNPKTLMDLIVLNGAGRGGADTQLYLDYRDSGSSLQWGNEIDNICLNTYGVPIFQEQFMHIYAFLLNTDFDDPQGRVDKMRKQIAKFRNSPEGNAKKKEFKSEIIKLSKDKGMNDNLAKELWHFFDLAHGYSFNLAHSTCYSYIAWQLLWYKYNHPLVYHAATLNACYKEEMQRTVNELQKQGIEIELPDACNSSNVWEAVNGKIYAPFTVIKGLGDLGAGEIINSRPFATASEFMDTVNLRRVNAGIRYKLYMCGAFNCLPDITGDAVMDSVILSIDKYDTSKDKTVFKNEVFEVTIYPAEIAKKINDHIAFLDTICKPEEEQKVVFGKVDKIVTENSKNPKVRGDKAVQYKLRDRGDNFIGWYSLFDTKVNMRLALIKEGTVFVTISSYGRLLPEYLELY